MSGSMTWDAHDYAKGWHLRHVPRWVAIRTLHQQSVAEHEFGVMLVARMLLQIHPKGHDRQLRLDVMELVLGHDREEAVTGDMPATGKPGFRKTPADYPDMTLARVMAKCADLIEAITFLTEEARVGNGKVVPIIQQLRERLVPWWNAMGSVVECGEGVDIIVGNLMPGDPEKAFPAMWGDA